MKRGGEYVPPAGQGRGRRSIEGWRPPSRPLTASSERESDAHPPFFRTLLDERGDGLGGALREVEEEFSTLPEYLPGEGWAW